MPGHLGFCLMDNVLFRWSTGDGFDSLFHTNLAIASLQRFCPEASYCISYNGKNFGKFKDDLTNLDNLVDFNNLIFNHQHPEDWPFSFDIIGGAWWKWAPINLGIKPVEVFIDTDVFFVNSPEVLRQWVHSDSDFYAPLDGAVFDLCFGLGDFKRFKPASSMRERVINVGVVGLKGNCWRDLFVRCSNINLNQIHTLRSYHINEQGAANYALELASRAMGFSATKIPFETYAWWCPKDFTIIEGIHFIADTKGEMSRFYSFFREAIQMGNYWNCQEAYDYVQKCVFQACIFDKEKYKEKYGEICCQMPRAKRLPASDLRIHLEI